VRKCRICGEEKEEHQFHFYENARTNELHYRTECISCRYKQAKERRKLSGHADHLQYEHGMTEAQYELLLKSQNGVCAICGAIDAQNNWSKYLIVDHDHKTFKIRGLLCSLCNRALGYFKDNPKFLRKAAEYLEKNK